MSTRCALCKEAFDPDRMVLTGSGLVCTACYAGMPGGTMTPSTGGVGVPATPAPRGVFSAARLLGNLFDIGFD
jgi:recombinational DNA repair protein (RecF pathway)